MKLIVCKIMLCHHWIDPCGHRGIVGHRFAEEEYFFSVRIGITYRYSIRGWSDFPNPGTQLRQKYTRKPLDALLLMLSDLDSRKYFCIEHRTSINHFKVEQRLFASD